MTEEKPENWREFPCVLEVDLEYPKELHDSHNDYPLAPESLEIGKVKKLAPNLKNKEKYILHRKNLKLYLSLGMRLLRVHRGIRFKEEAWMKSYIEKNTALRIKAKNSFDKDFFKLMNNSVFGKTMKNIRKRVDVKLVNSRGKARKFASLPNYKHCTIFDENLAAIHLQRTNLLFDKPFYVEMCILDSSKTLMYGFHYNYAKKKWKDLKLLFTDMDNLMYEIGTDDFFKDISEDVKTM